MPISKIDQPSHVIVDNSVLTMLTECHCAEHVGKPAAELLAQTQTWLHEQLTILQTTAIENQLHTTELVSAEYKPERGYLGTRGLPLPSINAMGHSVKDRFKAIATDANSVQALRVLPGASKRLVHPTTGLSNCDLSLVHLGLKLSEQGLPVIILSNDQDLIDFVTWIRTQKSLRVDPVNPQLIESETGLGYLELVHRGCKITSQQMNQIINFVIKNTVSRMEQKADGTQLNPQKAMRIIQKATDINSLFAQSMQIKLQNRSAPA